MAYKPAVRETEQCMETAREEAGLGAPDTLAFQCKHPANREYALFFMHMTDAAEIRSLDNGADSQWPKTLRKIAGSLCKLPTRVRSLDHANAIHGVGAKTLELFRKYLTKYPPEPPSEAELLADERATEATRAAKETEKAWKKRERDAKKTAAKPAPAAKPGTPNESQQQRNRYDPRGVDDDIIALDMDNTPPDAQNRNQNRPPAAEPPPAKKPKKKPPAKKPSRWEPGYRTAPFALLVTLHRLSLQGVVTTDKKTLMDEAEESDLSQQGIYPKGNADIAAAAAGGARGYSTCWGFPKSGGTAFAD
jgi:hypothetical protein